MTKYCLIKNSRNASPFILLTLRASERSSMSEALRTNECDVTRSVSYQSSLRVKRILSVFSSRSVFIQPLKEWNLISRNNGFV